MKFQVMLLMGMALFLYESVESRPVSGERPLAFLEKRQTPKGNQSGPSSNRKNTSPSAQTNKGGDRGTGGSQPSGSRGGASGK